MASKYPDLVEILAKTVKSEILAEKRSTIRDLDMFVLDNSLRESTVGQLRGHTLDNKRYILKEVKECGFKHIIVAAFSHTPRVDDAFVDELAKEEDTDSTYSYYAFSEIGEGCSKEGFPVGLKKMEQHKLRNPIFEIDLAAPGVTTEHMCNLLQKRIDYTYEKLAPNSKIFVNLRDLPLQ